MESSTLIRDRQQKSSKAFRVSALKQHIYLDESDEDANNDKQSMFFSEAPKSQIVEEQKDTTDKGQSIKGTKLSLISRIILPLQHLWFILRLYIRQDSIERVSYRLGEIAYCVKFNYRLYDAEQGLQALIGLLILSNIALAIISLTCGLLVLPITIIFVLQMHSDLQNQREIYHNVGQIQQSIPSVIKLYSRTLNLIGEIDYFTRNNEELAMKREHLVSELHLTISEVGNVFNKHHFNVTKSAIGVKEYFNTFVSLLITYYESDLVSMLETRTNDAKPISQSIQCMASALKECERSLQSMLDRHKSEGLVRKGLKERKAECEKLTPEKVYTNDLQRLSEYLRGVSLEVSAIKKELEKTLKEGRSVDDELRNRFYNSHEQLKHGLQLHEQCGSMFYQENLLAFGKQKEEFKFNQQKQQRPLTQLPDENEQQEQNQQSLEEQEMSLPAKYQTEVFENFDIDNNDDIKNVKTKFRINSTLDEPVGNTFSYQRPSYNFLSELKTTLEQRQQQKEEPIVYKEFDRETGAFREITREERDQKQLMLESKLQEKREKERRDKEQEERERKQFMMFSGGASPFGDLFAELKAKRGQDENCEVFGGGDD